MPRVPVSTACCPVLVLPQMSHPISHMALPNPTYTPPTHPTAAEGREKNIWGFDQSGGRKGPWGSAPAGIVRREICVITTGVHAWSDTICTLVACRGMWRVSVVGDRG